MGSSQDVLAVYEFLIRLLPPWVMVTMSFLCAALYLYRNLHFMSVLTPRAGTISNALWFFNIGMFYVGLMFAHLPLLSTATLFWFRIGHAGLMMSFIVSNAWVVWKYRHQLLNHHQRGKEEET